MNFKSAFGDGRSLARAGSETAHCCGPYVVCHTYVTTDPIA